MKITDEKITKEEAIKANMTVVKLHGRGTLYALPEGRTDENIQVEGRCFRRVVKRYKRIPESTAIYICKG